MLHLKRTVLACVAAVTLLLGGLRASAGAEIYGLHDGPAGVEIGKYREADLSQVWLRPAPSTGINPAYTLHDLASAGGYIYGLHDGPGAATLGKYREGDLSLVWLKSAPVTTSGANTRYPIHDLAVADGFIYGLHNGPSGVQIGKYREGDLSLVSLRRAPTTGDNPVFTMHDLAVSGGFVYGLFDGPGGPKIGKYQESNLTRVWLRDAPQTGGTTRFSLRDLAVFGGAVYGTHAGPGNPMLGKYQESSLANVWLRPAPSSGGSTAYWLHDLAVADGGTPAPTLASLTLAPDTIPTGTSTTATVTLTGPAPQGGASVALSAANSKLVTVPSTVLVAAGQSSATFTIATKLGDLNVAVAITATYSGVSRTASLTLQAPRLTVFHLSPGTGSVPGNSTVRGDVSLSAAAPAGGLTVALSSNNPAAVVPSGVSVPEGASSAAFTITTKPVTTTQTATLTARLNGASQSADLTIRPTGVKAVTVAPGQVIGGVQNGTITVLLDAPAGTGGVSVTLSSSVPTAAEPDSTRLTIPAGADTGTLTLRSHYVSAPADVQVQASAGGVGGSATLRVMPLQFALAMVPTTVTAGASATGTVILAYPAGPDGVRVTLSTSVPAAASVPTVITVPGGSTTGTFAVSTLTVSSDTRVTVNASFGGATQSAPLMVLPALAYTIVDIGILPGYESSVNVTGINASGQVVGTCMDRLANEHSFLWSNGVMTDLGSFGGSQTSAGGINASGQIAGWSDIVGPGQVDQNHGFLWENGQMTDLSRWLGQAYGINDAGAIAGVTYFVPMVFQNGTITRLPILGGSDGRAYAINNAGQVAGICDDASNNWHAVRWTSGSVEDLGSFGPLLNGLLPVSVWAINGAGAVVGDGYTGARDSYGLPIFHAMLWLNGKSQDLGTLGGLGSTAYGINGRGWIVGGSQRAAANGGSGAFLYDGAMRDLSELVPTDSGWILTEARAINDRGEIAGTGYLKGKPHAFLLRPR